MSGNEQKTAFGRSQNELARKKALDAIQITGKTLPCSIVSLTGWIATVKFEVNAAPWVLQNVTVPVASSEYDYLPFQVGDPGVVRAADARLGGLSGLGAGTAKLLTTPGNLATLVFEPFGKVAFTPPSNPNMRVVQGPDGVIVQDIQGRAIVTVDGAGKTITAKVGDDVSAIITDTDATLQYDDGGGNPIKVLVNSSGAQMEYGSDNYVNVTETTAEMAVGDSNILMSSDEIDINATTVKVNGTVIS